MSQAAANGKFQPYNSAECETIPYTGESTLCVVCKQRIDLLYVGDELLFKDCKQVILEGQTQTGVAH